MDDLRDIGTVVDRIIIGRLFDRFTGDQTLYVIGHQIEIESERMVIVGLGPFFHRKMGLILVVVILSDDIDRIGVAEFIDKDTCDR